MHNVIINLVINHISFIYLWIAPIYNTPIDQTCSCSENSNPSYQEVRIETAAFLEGAFSVAELTMSTKLNHLGYLPGQNPRTFLGRRTESGQPYKKKPWNYGGKEGSTKNKDRIIYPEDMVDWVLISLRETPEVSSTVLKRAAWLNKDGTIRLFADGTANCLDITKEYYIVIEHRNHLPVMSQLPVRIINDQLIYDFRYNPSYENGQKEILDGIYVMYGGNADQENDIHSKLSIDEDDIKYWETYNGRNSSYFNGDLDLSGDVSIRDQELIYRNLGVVSKVPF